MNDYDNLPSGISQTDGYNAGVNKFDDSFSAWTKVMTYEAGKGTAALNDYHESVNRARNSPVVGLSGVHSTAYPSASGQASGSTLSDKLQFRRQGIHLTSHIGNEIAWAVRNVVNKSVAATRSRYSALKVAGIILIILWSINFFEASVISPLLHLSYNHRGILNVSTMLLMLVDIIGITVLVFLIVKIKIKHAAEEKRLRMVAKCFLAALTAGYDIKLEKEKKNPDDQFSPLTFGNIKIPALLLTAKFLHHFNKIMLQKTGMPMNYKVYTSKFETMEEREFVIAHDVIVEGPSLDIARQLTMKELETLAMQSS